ncbi:hypothetical protein BN3660_03732 [Eubacteriaceae bacterium CHKCI004]|nr:hypothetical protein BN3660_03732 [Eubacteriaceae bacterium CHKCI004]
MEKYIINKEEFQLYFLMLQSKEISIVKEGVQKFSDAFAKGRHILNSDKKKFCKKLEYLLTNPKYNSIYKWIYKCTCFYSTPQIEKICKKNFFLTNDTETQNWIISTIASRYYSFEQFQTVINEMKHYARSEQQQILLLPKNIFYSASIFAHFHMDYNIKNIGDTIFRENDKNGMYWMAKLSAYSELAKKKELISAINQEELDMLTYSDNPQIQVYAYWGLVHRPGGKLKLSKEEAKRYIRINDSLKWYYAGIIPGEYINNNLDFITDILKNVNEQFRNNIRAKEGILIGLNSIPYDSWFDALIIDWYYCENYEKIKLKLLEYMIKNVQKNKINEKCRQGNGSFFSIIFDEWSNAVSIEYIKHYINLYKTLIYKKVKGKIILEFKENEREMSDYNINGGEFKGPVIMGNYGEIDIKQEKREDEELFIENLQKFIYMCNNQDLIIESKDVLNSFRTGRLDLKNKLCSLNSNLANFVTVVSATPQVLKIAHELIQYIEKII